MSSPDINFIERFGEAYGAWVDYHPTPDEENICFISKEGKRSYSPRQIAAEIKGKTPFGIERAQFYLSVSTILGDPTGERVIQDFLDPDKWHFK